MTQCKMCKVNEADSKSHIVSTRIMRAICGEDHLWSRSNDPDDHPQSRQGGAFDYTILCRACETKHQLYDKHAVEVIRKWDVVRGYVPDTDLVRGADATMLKLCFLSTLWRAAASSLSDFAVVAEYCASIFHELTEVVRAHDAQSQRFQVHLLCYTANTLEERLASQIVSLIPNSWLVPPWWHQIESRTVEIHLGRFVAIVTIEGKAPAQYDSVQLRPGQNVLVPTTADLQHSVQFKALMKDAAAFASQGQKQSRARRS